MLSELLAHWPSIILMQLIGVLPVWGADVLGWKWRRDENITFTFNLMGLVVVAPLLALSALFSPPTLLPQFIVSITWLCWLFLVAWVQKHQFKITLRAAFFGAMMQLGLFAILFCPIGVLFSFFGAEILEDWSGLILPVSMLGTYFLLTMFRPQLFWFWGTIRQNFKKN